jgi:pectinesterase
MDKPYIILKGAGKRNTIVEWGDHSSTFESPTFTSFADNIVVKSISFRVRNNLLTTNTLHFNNLLCF